MRDAVILGDEIQPRYRLSTIVLHEGAAVSKGAIGRTRQRIRHHAGDGRKALASRAMAAHKCRPMWRSLEQPLA